MDLISFLIIGGLVVAVFAFYYFTKPTKEDTVVSTALSTAELEVTPTSVVVEEVEPEAAEEVVEPVKRVRKPRAAKTTVSKTTKKKTTKKKTSLKVV
jgi:hypothetical protein